MMAALVLYALVVGLLLGLFGLLIERGVRQLGLPTRYLWASVMLAMVVVPAVGVSFTDDSVDSNQGRYAAMVDVQTVSSALGNSSSSPRDHQVVLTVYERVLAPWRYVLDRVDRASRDHDVVLLVTWASMSSFLLGLTLHALSEARRLRQGFELRTVDGVAVYLTETLGPSAVGGRPAAIVIPRWVMGLDQSLRALVLRHEQQHLAVRDPALLTGALFLLVLIPWHVGLWWAWGRLRLAIEIDCDARVLRERTSPKQYAQLLLLMVQQRIDVPLRQHAMMSLAAPLRPQAAHLKNRIDAMTTPPAQRRVPALLALAAGIAGAASLIAAIPAPVRDGVPQATVPSVAGEVVVKVNRAGSKDVEVDNNGKMVGEILIYGAGPAKVGMGLAQPQFVGDTIRLKSFQAFTADVTDSDVHVELRGRGELELAGNVVGGPATNVAASGRHLVLMKGGFGIRTVRP